MKIKKRGKAGKPSLAASFKSRSFRVGGYSMAAAVIVLAIAVAVNVLVSALPSSMTQFDTTANELYTISEQTENIVRGLDRDVTIYWVVQSGQEDSTLGTLLDQYEALSSHVTVEKKDPDVQPTFLQQYAIDSVYNNSLIVECDGRYRYVDYYDIYVYDYSSYYYDYSYDVSFAGESELTSAIDYVINEDLPTLYLLTGHGEATMASSFSTAVEKENIQPQELSLLTKEGVPEDADCVLIYAPQSDISEEEKEMLLRYLQGGGSLLLITDPPLEGKLTNLEALMAEYGVTAAEGIVVEGKQSNYVWQRPYYLLPDMATHAITSPLKSSDYYVLLPIAQGLLVSDGLRDGLSVTQLLTTSGAAYSKIDGYELTTYEKEEGDLDGPFALAVAITETVSDEESTHIVWVSSASLLDEQTNAQVSGGNQDFFLNCLNWMCETEESSIAIHAKSLSYEYLTMDSSTASRLSILIVGIIPLAYLGTGITIWIRRKRR